MCIENTRVLKTGDIVIDSKTASKIAEIILSSVYGNKALDQLPYEIKSSNDRWKIYGTITSKKNEVVMGGTMYLELRKSDAKVLAISLDK